AGKGGPAPEGKPDRVFAEPIDGRARHPAVELIRSVGALLVEADAALAVDPELVPAHAAAAGGSIDRVHGDDRFTTADVAVDQPRHDLVALRIEAALGAGLRHAVGELTAAQ